MKAIAVDIESVDLSPRYDKDAVIHCAHIYGYVAGKLIDLPFLNICSLINTIHTLMREDDETQLVFHNASFDYSALSLRGLNIPIERIEDTMGMAYCLEPDSKKSLRDLASRYLGETKLATPDFSEYSNEMAEYNRVDTKLTYELYCKLLPRLMRDEQAWQFWNEIEKPYIQCIIEMQQTGAYIDDELLTRVYDETVTYVKECKRDINKLVTRKRSLGIPEVFNPNSSKQVGEQLLSLGWVPTKFGTSGAPSVSKDILKSIAKDYPFAAAMVKYNKWNHFVTNTLNYIKDNRLDGRVYGSFNQFLVRTGRLSSSKPNLQNIPARDERGDSSRKMFIAPEGYKCVVGDLDRIELVVLAFYLEEVLGYSTLADQIRNGIDIHTENAKRWHKVSETVDGFKQKHRRPCKNGIFSLVYGAGAAKFAGLIDVTVQEAQDLIKSDELLVAVARLKKVIVKEAKENRGILYTYMGRRLYIPEVLDEDQSTRAYGERCVFNYMIQGTAGDIFKYLQLQLKTRLEKEAQAGSNVLYYGSQQVIVVHDEAFYYVLEALASDFAEVASHVYSDKELLGTIPISCEFNVGNNWYEAKGD